jgi:multicomponent Na+:H+ antiporter subunit C
MIVWLALGVAIASGCGLYLAMSRDLLRCTLGLALIGAAANLALFASGRLGSMAPAVIVPGASRLAESANPLPQALVLTAIVIGFALMCFALVLVLRLIDTTGSDDVATLHAAEPLVDDPVKPPAPADDHEPVWPPIATGSKGARP